MRARWLKSSEQHGSDSTVGVLRLRATSAVSRDQYVRRSAQDDDSVREFDQNILNKLALMGLRPGLLSDRLVLRCAPVGMTIFLGHSHSLRKYELSSRPERSEVEGPVVKSALCI